jgi:hypothetical protein
MTTKEAIRYTAELFIEKRESPSETDIRLTLNDLVYDHNYAQDWAVRCVKARLRKHREAVS